jgi:putative beta-1,4-xylosyltransferase IRX10
MAGISSKINRHTGAAATTCTRTHQIGALALVIVTFFLTRVFHQSFSASLSVSNAAHYSAFETENDAVLQHSGGLFAWPHRGFGTHLSLKIYVYDENEIEGLKLLLYGRDGKISPEACIKGQWGTQVGSLWRVFICLF